MGELPFGWRGLYILDRTAARGLIAERQGTRKSLADFCGGGDVDLGGEKKMIMTV